MPIAPAQLQSRDFDLLHGLFESRIMTTAHIATMYFDGKREAAKKRLQKLKAAKRKEGSNLKGVLPKAI